MGRSVHTGSVDAGIWGIVAVLVIGTAVVGYGWWSDRADDRRRAEAMKNPPERGIPRFSPDSPRPRYLSELEAVTRPGGLAPTELDDATRRAIKDALAGSPRFAAGLPDQAFITDPETGWCVVNEPLVVICDDQVSTMRELLPVVKLARELGRPVVLVAPAISDEVRTTLRANWVQGGFSCLPLTMADDRRRSLASLTAAQPASESDLRAGYLPSSHAGSCHTWVSDKTTSWVLLEGLK